MAESGAYEEHYLSAASARSKEKKRGIFSVLPKSTSGALSTQLKQPIALSMKPHYPCSVSFTTDDKLIIIFRYKQKFVVYKKSNGTVAVLENPVFKQSKPPVMFDGGNMGALLHNIQPVLTYAVAKTDFCERDETILQQNDVVLILARCRDIFLGITKGHRVYFFPSQIVDPITQPRICFFEGMMLTIKATAKVKAKDPNQLSLCRKHNYDITKGKDGLFDWFASNHLKVPLHACGEIGTKVVTAIENEGFYHTIQELQDKPSKELPPKVTLPPIPSPIPVVPSVASEFQYYNVPKLQGKPTPPPLPPRIPELPNVASEYEFYEVPDPQDKLTPPPPPPRIPVLPNDLPEHSKEESKPQDQSRNPQPGDTYENAEQIEDLKKQIDALKLLISTQPDNTLKTENDHLYEEPSSDGAKQKSQRERKIEQMLDKLHDFRDMSINENLRGIVAEYVEEDVWHQLGKTINVPVNRRKKIEQEKDEIYEKTYDLLGHWHSRYGNDATLGVLLDALIEVNPEDLHLIMEDICKTLEDEDGYQIPPP